MVPTPHPQPPYTLFYSSDSQSMVTPPAAVGSPGIFLEMQILGPARPTESITLGVESSSLF